MTTTNNSMVPLNYLTNTAAVFGCAPIAIGINALLRPRSSLKSFGFTTPVTPTDQETVDGLIQMYASRDIAVGLSTLAMCYYGSPKALACTMLAGCVMTGTDGWVVRRLVGKGQWVHWGLSVPGIILGACLFDWI